MVMAVQYRVKEEKKRGWKEFAELEKEGKNEEFIGDGIA